MNPEEYREPWTHWIIDDFLSSDHYKMLKLFSSRWPRGKTCDKVNILLAEFHLFEETYLYQKEAGLFDAILLKYADKLANHFDIVGKYDLIEIAYSSCGAGYSYPVHTDLNKKILSNILYLSEKGEGTRLFSEKNGEVKKQSPWKPNRLFSFKRGEDTWHDYKSENGNRATISINFVASMGSSDTRKNYRDRKNITKSIWPEGEQRLTLCESI